MRYLTKSTNTKAGLISLCLTALVGCSTNAPASKIIKPPVLQCPHSQQCRLPSLRIQNNGDLAKALDQTMTTIELCQIELQAYEQCVEQYNQTNQQAGH